MTNNMLPTTLPTRDIAISQLMINAYAQLSGDFNTVHVDPSAGRAAGFGGAIAHGCIPLEPVFASIQAWLGVDVLPEDTAMRLRYRAPARPGDLISAEADVVRRSGGGSFVTVEFKCRNQHGTVVIDGACDLLRQGGAR